MTIAVLVVAAGRGARIASAVPKQYLPLAGRSLLAHTLESLCASRVDAVLVAINPDDRARYQASVDEIALASRYKLLAPVAGGATRQDSVRLGLQALAEQVSEIDFVLIHDGARLFPSQALVERAIVAATQNGAAVPALPVTDTIKQIDEAYRIVATPHRDGLRAVQTPQAFRFKLIYEAHLAAKAAGAVNLTDDAAIAEWAGHPVHVFEGETGNMKVTTPDDLALAAARLDRPRNDIRTGQGYDVHAFGPGDHIWLGGCKVPHSHGLVGHSDADVLSHAITDALYGALCDGDIGSHFPPSDPQWKGADSSIFLRAAADAVRARGGIIANVDATVVCETPKVGPVRDGIRQRLSEIMDVALDRIAVKATTSERLGFTGRQEGIATLAIVTIRLPDPA